jgi:hypothetical protein
VNNTDLEKAVFTLKGVIKSSMPILYVVHDTDDEWQFLSDGEVSMEDMMIVTMGEITKIDPSVGLLSLDMGYEAVRKSVNVDWVIRKAV